MVTGRSILKELSGYDGKQLKIADNQTVSDIIAAISHSHKIDAKDYDKIAHYFVGATPYQTCKNIFDFLKRNTKYFQEPGEMQTVKSPAAILREKYIDCKNYSLFAGGILDAINRSGVQNIPFVYRFVSHSFFDPSFNHVFVVAFPGTDNEIFIDPIPENETFTDRYPYYFSTDKNFSSMALYRVSGSVGAVDPLTAKISASVITQGVKVGTDAAGGLIAAITSANGVSPSFFNTFKFLRFLDNSVGQWKSKSAAMRSWTPEQRISYYIDRINAGDNYHNAVQQYAELYGQSYMPSKGTPDDRGRVPVELLALFNELAEQRYFKGSDTVQDGGFVRQKSQVLNDLRLAPDYNSYIDKLQATATPENKKAQTNMFITLGIVAAAVIFLTTRKKSQA